MTAAPILRVAINAPLSRLFDYLPPDASPASLQPGSRVKVPFGRRNETGLIVGHASESDVPRARLRRAVAALDESALLGEADMWLIRFASQYYHHPIGEVVAAALPAALRQGRALNTSVSRVSVTSDGAAVDPDSLQKRAPKQAALLRAVADSATFEELDQKLPGWRRIRGKLLEKGWVEITELTEAPAAAATSEPVAGPSLNEDQANALAAIRQTPGFHVCLLDGVTGSGKTEVYLQLMLEVLNAGRQVLILVPEIGLTPQLVERLGARLGEQPVVMHSGLTDTARLSAWRAARCGSAGVVLGTRSAVFSALKSPGLIIVDEEHDSSLKQQEGFRYSARDLAVARGKYLNVPVVLGSATPSLESLKRCADGAYRHLQLPSRAAAAAPPLLRLIDLNRHGAADGISEPAIAAIKDTLNNDGQVLVFLNRRGFAPTLICGGCGHIAECDRCDARMTVHAGSQQLRCHHCGACRTIDDECADCGGTYRPLGHGTERLEETLKKRFPRHSIARVDSDTTRLKGTMDKALSMATTGATKILVGTQMLSKGHHFPNLTLVIVVNADQGLFSTDFRGSERLAQSLVQVAGRAGREKRQGEVLIQTAYPKHPFWSELFRGGYEQVAASALEERSRTAWPPFTRLALLRASAHRKSDTTEFLQHARKLVEAENRDNAVRVLGPVSAPMERRAGRYRTQLLLQSGDRLTLQKVLQSVRLELESDNRARKVRWSVDVDPIELF